MDTITDTQKIWRVYNEVEEILRTFKSDNQEEFSFICYLGAYKNEMILRILEFKFLRKIFGAKMW